MSAGSSGTRSRSRREVCPKRFLRSGPTSSSAAGSAKENRFSSTAGRAESARPLFRWPEHSARGCSRPPAPAKNAWRASSLGAERAINYKTARFRRRADGSHTWPRNRRDSRHGGRRLFQLETWICWRSKDGCCRLPCFTARRREINLVRLLRQRLTVTGSTLRARTVEEKGAIA